MKNFIKEGKRMTITVVGAAVTSGQLIQVGDLHGVAVADADVGEEVELSMEGVFEVPAEAAAGIQQGDSVYFDGGSVDKDGANKLVGAAYTDQDASDMVHVKLKN